MGRKRLLTILAGAVAVLGLHMAPASALDVSIDLDRVQVDASVSEEGLEAGVSDGDDDQVSAKVSEEDGVEAKVGDTEISSEDVTDQVEETTSSGPTGSEEEPDSGNEESSTPTEQPTGGGQETASQQDVAAAGGARSAPADQPDQRPDALDPDQARAFLAGSGGPDGDVEPAFDLSADARDTLEGPIVAAPGAPSTDDAYDWETASPEPPETAGERSDAELAAIPARPSGDRVPAGLKLVAALLVAGTGTVWHLTRRELQPAG